MTAEDFRNDLSSDLAQAAFNGVSHFPERRAESTRNEYAQTLAADFADLEALADTEEKRAALPAEFARYRDGYGRRYRAYLASSARCVSWFIAGPANFPARRMEKRHNVVEARLRELVEFRTRALAAIRKTLRPELRAIYAGDADATERLAVKIAQAEAIQERMRDANAAIRAHKKDGPERQVDALRALGFPEAHARALLKPDFIGRVGFPDYALTNNNANLRRMKERLGAITRAKAAPVTEFNGENARLEDNPGENRVRLFFFGKPPAEVRADLKRAGFRWTPTLGAWQAYPNEHTLTVARHFAGPAVAGVPAPVP
jgi:hypothetical protein